MCIVKKIEEEEKKDENSSSSSNNFDPTISIQLSTTNHHQNQNRDENENLSEDHLLQFEIDSIVKFQSLMRDLRFSERDFKMNELKSEDEI